MSQWMSGSTPVCTQHAFIQTLMFGAGWTCRISAKGPERGDLFEDRRGVEVWVQGVGVA